MSHENPPFKSGLKLFIYNPKKIERSCLKRNCTNFNKVTLQKKKPRHKKKNKPSPETKEETQHDLSENCRHNISDTDRECSVKKKSDAGFVKEAIVE